MFVWSQSRRYSTSFNRLSVSDLLNLDRSMHFTATS